MREPRYPGLAKVQHYVPKCLLRGFTAGKSDKVWVYDKTDCKPFLTAVKNVAAKQGFYNLATPQGIATLEPFLGRVEDRVAELFTRRIAYSLDEDDSIGALQVGLVSDRVRIPAAIRRWLARAASPCRITTITPMAG